MARNSRELAQRPAVDPQDEPSAEWGWHGSWPRLSLVAGWATVAILLLMLIGNHQGRTEDLYLIGTAIALAGALVLESLRRRNSWRR